MSLELLVAQGRAMLKEPLQDGPWAYKACSLSREFLEDVLECYPPTEYVEQEIIPLLHELVKAIQEVKLKPEDSFSNYTQGFLKNINSRISKLERYVAGLPIVVPPKHSP